MLIRSYRASNIGTGTAKAVLFPKTRRNLLGVHDSSCQHRSARLLENVRGMRLGDSDSQIQDTPSIH